MERGCKNESVNIYRACRERAAQYNDALNAREKAAELLGVSTSSLANYELGVTKSVPVDMVVMMADLYNAPELRNYYCKNECPIGRGLPMATEVDGLQSITVRILNSLDEDEIKGMRKKMLEIARDGNVSADEKSDFQKIVGMLERLATDISELRMLAEKYEKGV